MVLVLFVDERGRLEGWEGAPRGMVVPLISIAGVMLQAIDTGRPVTVKL